VFNGGRRSNSSILKKAVDGRCGAGTVTRGGMTKIRVIDLEDWVINEIIVNKDLVSRRHAGEVDVDRIDTEIVAGIEQIEEAIVIGSSMKRRRLRADGVLVHSFNKRRYGKGVGDGAGARRRTGTRYDGGR
jgi:hypothetical protein